MQNVLDNIKTRPMKIKNVHAREILDSNGIPTISTQIEMISGDIGRGDVPSGASTGKTEVIELRDGDKKRYGGKGVLKAVDIVNTKIRKLLIGEEFTSQREFDQLLIKADGTKLKSSLGGNAILSCSMAFARAVCNSFGLNLYEYLAMTYWEDEYTPENLKLPTPQILALEGGKHGNWSTDIQEYMVVPNKEVFKTFSSTFEAGTKIFHKIHEVLDEKGYSVGVGFEGAYTPKEIKSNEEAFEIILEGIEKAGFSTPDDFTIAIDVASSQFYNKEKDTYNLKREGKDLNSPEWYDLQKKWYSKYPISSIEDPFYEDDWESWSEFTKELGGKYQIVGDDLLTTNTERIEKGIDKNAMNAVLIKLNQIGTITETLEAIRMSVDEGMDAIVSHRSGETNDDFIADLVVATPAQYSKFGAPCRGERIVKYNRLLEIENLLSK
jgi:enolase